MNVIQSDQIILDKNTARTRTPEGFLLVPGVLARTGVQVYKGYQVPSANRPAMDDVKLYRPPDEVFHMDSLSSFAGVPVTLDHPADGLVTADTWKAHSVGEVRSVSSRDGRFMEGIICIRDSKAIEAIDSGKRELSNGYTYSLDMTPGVSPEGQAYDGIQRNIRGNHVAIVDAARCGSACRISDSQPSTKGKIPMSLRNVVVDGIQLEVSETAASAIVKLEKDRNDALALAVDSDNKAKALVEEHKASTLKLQAEHQTAIDALKKDVMTPEARDAMVSEWVNLTLDAKRLAPTVATDKKTCVQIRREVVDTVAKANDQAQKLVTSILAGTPPEKATDEQYRVLFNAVSALSTDKPASASAGVGDALLGQPSGAAVDIRTMFATGLDQTDNQTNQ